MPWTPEDDPILKELRAWRHELGTDGQAGDPAAETVRPVSPVGAPAARGGAQAPTSDVSKPEVAPQPAISSERRHAAKPTREPVRPRRVADEMPWLPFSRLSSSVATPQPTIDVRSSQPAERSVPRHAMWDVMSSGPAEPEPIRTAAERELADASTVAFPTIVADHLADDAPVEIAIEASKLHKRFGEFVAVHDVSFSVPKGKIVALLGPNGAGKTTTVNMLCTLLKPDGGSATVAGCDVADDAPGVRRAIMLTGQFAALDEALTGRENLILFGRLLGMTKKSAGVRADELLAEFGLTEAAGRRVGQYSGGMRRRIDIACGLVTKPEVVFLDEPTTGLDPRSRQDVWTVVEQLRDSGVTILLTTQYLEEADVLSDNIVVIDKGRVIAEGTSNELKAETGAAYCEITPSHPAYLPRLRARLRDMIGDAENSEPDALTVSVPAPDGPTTLAEVIRRTEAAKIPLADIALRRPSLDEVFLALTGDGSGSEADDRP
ncbi:ATP-binding cassette domain-containing protein [Gordonia hydrophobica]|uniref:ATP-binding cassette domain-containing protein n=2 Tax=Gordonia hydrophobica TaxID=40516 RepID=A0ABZ2U7E6_9ACTN|nr:ATP-binding cassette domain-containing protein [Gordonia hydrophobica]